MYQTLLCSQLLSVENAHCLRAGALNDEMDEEQGGVVQACRLPQQYNALMVPIVAAAIQITPPIK